MKLVLIGMMGSGKSSVGRKVAKELNWDFYDVDSEIEKEAGKKISDIFASSGELDFRSLEKNMIQNLSQKDKIVLSTGGGAPCSEENWKALSQNGLILWLKASPEKLLERIQRKPLETRPLLMQKSSPLETLSRILQTRENIYKKAEYIVETEHLTLQEVTKKIVNWVKSKE